VFRGGRTLSWGCLGDFYVVISCKLLCVVGDGNVLDIGSVVLGFSILDPENI
jgi:hypothetical protein